jgi:hypothetical protein
LKFSELIIETKKAPPMNESNLSAFVHSPSSPGRFIILLGKWLNNKNRKANIIEVVFSLFPDTISIPDVIK